MHVCVASLVAITHVDAAILKVAIVDVGDVCNPRVGDIHAVKIASAHAIPRDKWFTKTKRAPSKLSAETKTHADPAAKPGNQRGSIVRASINRAGRPSPPAASIDPTAIMERS